MVKGLPLLSSLNSLTFRYKEELDPDKIPQFGLIAEEVEKVNSDLVVRDEEGKIGTVRCGAVSAMLLNEFLKKLGANLTNKRQLIAQQKQIETLTTTLQRVSDRVGLAELLLRFVAPNHETKE